jgi:hypothetical protein
VRRVSVLVTISIAEKNILMKHCLLASLVFAAMLALPIAVAARPTTVVLDTDIASDIDDVGALSMLNSFQTRGLCNIAAVIVDSANQSSPGAVLAVDTYFGRPDIPIGQVKTGGVEIGSSYTKALSDLVSARTPMDSTELYRKTLAKAKNGSVTVVIIGYMTAFDQLLKSAPDQFSKLAGEDLAKAKISRVVDMGGDYPSGIEHNLMRDAPSAADAVSRLGALAVPTYFLGWTAGVSVQTGGAQLPDDDPVRIAWNHFNGNHTRSSWDEMTALYAVQGEDAGFRAVSGTNSIDPSTGKNTFTEGAGTEFELVKTQPDRAYEDAINAGIGFVPAPRK